MDLAERIAIARRTGRPAETVPAPRPPVVVSPFTRRAIAGTLPAKDLTR